MNPIEQFIAERNLAREAADPMAHLCTVANADDAGQVHMRTLVLRDVPGGLGLFINATSPKWPYLSKAVDLLTYWPSTQIQYRIHADVAPLAADLIKESWQLRPPAPKKMDWFYHLKLQQSSEIEDRAALLQSLDGMTAELPEELHAPEEARGLLLNPTRIERLDLTQENGVHDRTLASFQDDQWTSQTLVP